MVFWFYWIIVTGGLLISALYFSCIGNRNTSYNISNFHVFTTQYFIISVIFLAIAAYLLFNTAQFGFTDDDIFLRYYLNGIAYPPPVWEHDGRFFPLGHQEWRMIYFWSTSSYVYYFFVFIQLSGFLYFTILLLRKFGNRDTLMVYFILSFTSVSLTFSALVFPERNILFLLPIFCLAVFNWDRSGEWKWLFTAGAVANIMLYFKEPMFIVVGAFAVVGTMRFLFLGSPIHNRRLLLMDVLLTVLCICWILFYLSFVEIQNILSGRGYHSIIPRFGNITSTMKNYLVHEPTMVVTLCFGIIILFYYIRRLPRKMTVPEGRLVISLGMGSIGYFIVLLFFGLNHRWYSSIPIASMGLMLSCSETGLYRWKFVWKVLLTVCIILNISFSIPVLLYKKDWISMTNGVGNYINESGISSIYIDAELKWDKKMMIDLLSFLSPNICIDKESPETADAVVALSSSNKKRKVTIKKGSEILWSYDSEYFHRFVQLMPISARPFFQNNYAIW